MRRVVLFLFFVLPVAFVSAQVCEPDSSYADSTAGVYPRPYDPELSPNGGINECAYLNQDFDFTFTIVINDSFIYNGNAYPIEAVEVLSVGNLPTGLALSCEPSSCYFPKNTISCAKIAGVPLSSNEPKDYDLMIFGKVFLPVFPFELPISFPDANLAPGKYTLKLLEDDSQPCGAVATQDPLSKKVQIILAPNPSAGPVEINLQSNLVGQTGLSVADLTGRLIHHRQIELVHGENRIVFDGSELPDGMYILRLENEYGQTARKFTIQH